MKIFRFLKPKWQKMLVFLAVVLLFNFANWDLYILDTASNVFKFDAPLTFVLAYGVLIVLLYLAFCYLTGRVIKNQKTKTWEMAMFIGLAVGAIFGLFLFAALSANYSLHGFLLAYLEFVENIFNVIGVSFSGTYAAGFYTSALIGFPLAVSAAVGGLIGKAVRKS